MSGKEDEVYAILVIEGRHINYLAIAARQGTSVINVSGRMHSYAFERGL